MAEIHTVRGAVDSTRLGRVLVHEHVFVMSSPEYIANYRTDWDENERVAQAVTELTELKAAGIDTIMDPTVWGLGRYLPRIQQVAEQVEINIVPATGLYTYGDVPMAVVLSGPGTLLGGDDPLPEMFVKDLTEGIADTGIKAAFLKCAIDAQGLTAGVERAMRAVGRASVETGAPITVHTDAHSKSGLIAQQVLGEEGVDLTKVIIGHSGDTTDIDYLTELADAGSMLGMDRFGIDALLPTEGRVATIAAMIEKGYLEHLTMAHDAFCFADFFPPGEPRATMWPEHTYMHIPQKVLPALREAGVGQEQIDVMLVDNPRRHLESRYR